MLTELSLTNFKSWKKIDRMRLAPITGLFGTNSSGKTSVEQLLLMLKQTVESSDRAQVLEFGDERGLTNLGSFRDVVFAHEQPGRLTFSFQWDLEKPLRIQDPQSKTALLFEAKNLGFECQLAENGRLSVEKFCYSLDREEFTIEKKDEKGSKYELREDTGAFRFVRTPGRAWDLPAPVKFYGFPDQVYTYYQNAGFLADLQLEFENFFRNVYYLGPLREFPQRHYTWKGSEPSDMGRRGERVVDALLAARQRGAYISPGYKRRRMTLEERIATWLKQLGLISDFAVERISDSSNLYQVKVRRSATSPEVLITDVGFGVSQILPVLVLCYYVPEGSTVILEQPEIHLHPKVQGGLADVFIDAMQNRNIQILLESHSEHLLRRLQRRIAEQQIDPTDAALYFCSMSDAGSKLTALDVDLYGNIKNWPKDFFGDEFGEMAAITRAAMERKKERSV